MGHPQHKNICVSTLVPAFIKTDIRRNSQYALGDKAKWDKIEPIFEETKQGKMIKATEMSPTELANIVYDGLREKKIVIPTHLEWHEAVIKDRMEALLNCEKDKKVNIKRAIRASIAKSKQSKL